MKRTEKGKSVTRYLTGHSGIVNLRWDGLNNHIDGPYAYYLDVSTDGRADRFFQGIRELPDDERIAAVIRYDKWIDGVDKAVVGCTLRTFAVLLGQYDKQYE